MSSTVAWNLWHGCHKVSTGCKNCYMFSMDRSYGKDPEDIHLNNNYLLPISEDRYGLYKYNPGTHFMTNITSDTFLEEAYEWLPYLWSCVRIRKDCIFHIFTKRVDRIKESLPDDWDSLDNVEIIVSCENQDMANKRFDTIKDIPIKHLSISASPLLECIDFSKWFYTLNIDTIYLSGERDFNPRPCNFEWVKNIKEQCVKAGVNFIFNKTGSMFICNGKTYRIKYKRDQESQAEKAGLNYICKQTLLGGNFKDGRETIDF